MAKNLGHHVPGPASTLRKGLRKEQDSRKFPVPMKLEVWVLVWKRHLNSNIANGLNEDFANSYRVLVKYF